MPTEYDVVVVGGGPRALQALVDLDDAVVALALPCVPSLLRVAVIDDAPAGAGSVWDAGQPEHLIMNLDPTSVDFRSRTGLVQHAYRGWEALRGYGAFDYPPRARMGEYLRWVFGRLQSSPRLRITHVRARGEGVARSAGGWIVRAAGGRHGEFKTEELRAREVLLCTGHLGGPGLEHHGVVSEQVGPGAGAPVAIRGAALTGMDVVLDLTAGRGSGWSSSPDSPSGLRWVPSGREPSSITLLSRSGELMTPKPEVRDVEVETSVRAVTAQWRPGAVPDDQWWEVLVGAAVRAAAAHGLDLDHDLARDTLDVGRGVPPGWQERWCADLCRAAGITDEDPAWWLGRAWSAGYSSMVASLERGPRDSRQWYRWRERSARLERWAFGPPAATVRRLLALGESDVLHVSTMAGPRSGNRVDAVTRGPGVLARPGGLPGDPLWRGLLEAGHVSVRPHERGVLTLRDGRCVGADGTATEGLSALGRPTEDPVIGHDTLSRTLHGEPLRWASRVARAWAEVRRPGAEEMR